MLRVFINYRRQDAADYAQRLHDHLAARFDVFRDNKIELGQNFKEAIVAQLVTCDVLIAVIGSQWLEIGMSRLRHLDDYVRLEIGIALSRKITVIPLLVDNATMPQEQQLPEAIAGLALCQALRIRDWDRDMELLIERLEKIEGKAGVSENTPRIRSPEAADLWAETDMLDTNDPSALLAASAHQVGDQTAYNVWQRIRGSWHRPGAVKEQVLPGLPEEELLNGYVSGILKHSWVSTNLFYRQAFFSLMFKTIELKHNKDRRK